VNPSWKTKLFTFLTTEMATRRRRNNATTTETVSAHIPDGAWDDFSAEAPEVLEVGMTPEEAKKFHDWEKSQIDNAIDIARKVGAEAPEPTHEEMLEVAAEREEVAQFLDVVAEEAFSNLGEQDFFEPAKVLHPAQVVPAKQKPVSRHNVKRVITRNRKS
jgi:hypothetical protein